MKIMKTYGTARLFNVMTIVILKTFETQSQKKFYFQWESNCCCSDDRVSIPNRMRIEINSKSINFETNIIILYNNPRP